MNKKLMGLLFGVCLCVFSVMPIPQQALAAASGTTETGINWTLDNSGTLTISGSGGMGYFSSPSSVPWNEYAYDIKKVTIKNGVTSIANWAFYGCSTMESITIPDSVESIGDYAFSRCHSMSSIHMPKGVYSISTTAFYGAGYGANSLKEVTVAADNENYTAVDGVLFNKDKTVLMYYPYSKEGLTYSIPSGVERIASYAFATNIRISKVIIPDTVTAINTCAFEGCSSLNTVEMSDSVTTMGRNVFAKCYALSNVTLSKNITKIPYGAFDGCRLGSIVIPDKVTLIGSYAFNGTSLSSVTIPQSVVCIGINAFNISTYENSLNDVYYKGNEIQWEGIFIDEEGNSALSSAAIHYSDVPDSGECGDTLTWSITDDTLNIVGSGEMYDYPDLYPLWYLYKYTDISISNGVTSIGVYAFYETFSDQDYDGYARVGDNHLTTVRIPKSVKNIGNSAFNMCKALTDVYYSGSEADWKKITIGSNNEYLLNANIHYNSVLEPTQTVEIITLYDEAFEKEKMNVVEVNLGSDNGKKALIAGENELYYSVERNVYVGIAESANISGNSLSGVVVYDREPIAFVYGNVDGDNDYDDISEAVDTSDLQAMKLAIKGINALTGEKLIASDLDGDGLCDTSDLQNMKLYVKRGTQFPVLK